MSYRAWWTYWLALVACALVALGVAFTRIHLGASEPGWVAALSLPLVIAGVDLVLYRSSHERICAVEARQHGWLGVLVGHGYSARAFLLSGIVLIASGLALAATLLSRG